MADDNAPARILRHLHGVQRLGYRANLVELDKHGIAGVHRDALADEFGIRRVQVIADELRPAAYGISHNAPIIPVVFRDAVFDADNRVIVHPVLVDANQLVGGVVVSAQFGRRHVQRNEALLARAIIGALNGLYHKGDRILVIW